MLGIGTFKKIYKGYDYNTGREVAWCEINTEQMDSQENNNINNNPNILLLLKNIANIQKLKHPNLLEYISSYYKEDKNKIIIITELLQGGNLKEYRKYQKKLKVKLVKKWLKQILSALDFLHSNNLIHHDIKSKNILVDRISGDLKLGDLIFAEKGENGFFTKYVGKEEYMAPEVKEGKYTFKADIYSLGLTIVQFITMEKPYKEYCRKKELYEAKKKGIYPLAFNKIKNEEIKNFISLCLKPEKERPSCKELLNNPWLNDKDSLDNNSFIELSNELNKFCYKYKSSFNHSNDSLLNKGHISTFIPIRPIYSLDISKSYNNDCPYANKNSGNKYIIKYNSFRSCKPIIKKDANKKIKSLFSISNNLNENKNNESRSIFSDKDSNKYFNEYISDDNIFDINHLLEIYLYFIEHDGNFFLVMKEKENLDENNNVLLCIKIIAGFDKMKDMNIKGKIQLGKKNEKDNLNIIMEQLGNFIELNKKDILLIRNKLKGKIEYIMKKYKIIIIKEKINKIIKNLQNLVNSNDFDFLDCIINCEDINRIKFPKEIDDKLKYYENKKSEIINIFCLHNITSNDDEFYNDKGSEFLIINLS